MIKKVPEMELPVCLIENSNGQLKTCEEGLKILESIQMPLVVVAIAGLYRTGKSYLMNRLCEKRQGFSLGATVQSHTKGIWMWAFPHPTNPEHCLMVLDTEGLADAEKGDESNDKWLFTLAILLSSLFVYNSMKKIDQHALSDLHFVTELSDLVKVKAQRKEKEVEDLGRFLPSFVWAIRDFDLELEIDGKEVTADQYLENCLKLKNETNEQIRIYNTCRKCIRHFFPERKCFIFPQPTGRKYLRNLEKIPDSKLDEEFVEESRKFCNYIYNHAKPKTIQGSLLNGRLLSTLLQGYIECISSGQVPCLQSAVQSLADIENSKAVIAAEQCYRDSMDEMVMFPTKDARELLQHHIICEKKAINVFIQHFFLDEENKFQNEMKHKIQFLYQQYCEKNEEESEKKCQTVLAEVFKVVEEKLKSNQYAKPGGYLEYSADRERAEQEYLATPGKGVKAEDVLLEFKQHKTSEASTIMAMDESLTEKNKEVEAEKQKAANAEMMEKITAEKMKSIQQHHREMIESHERNIDTLKKQMEEDRQRFINENENVLQRKLQEQQRFIEEGHRRETELLQKQIQELERNISSSRHQRSGGGCTIL